MGAGAFEITSRRLPFERVTAAMSKAIFDMGFVMADVRPPLPSVSAGVLGYIGTTPPIAPTAAPHAG